jgi:ketosteroid isomerase-like protein
VHRDAELIVTAFQAFAAGDLETVGGILAEDIMWRVAGTSVLSGEYRGREAVYGFFGKVAELTEGTFQQDVHAILADDDHVVVLLTDRWDKPTPFASDEVLVFHFRDGQAVECWSIHANQAGMATALA